MAEAYDTLSDDKKRAEYDMQLLREQQQPSPPPNNGSWQQQPFGFHSGAFAPPFGFGQPFARQPPFIDPFDLFQRLFHAASAFDEAPPFDHPALSGRQVHPAVAQRLGGSSAVVSVSTSSQTVIRNGQRTTKTTKVTRYADGRVETESGEETGQAGWGGARLGGGGERQSAALWGGGGFF